MLGIICIARNFSPWFYGAGYEKVPYLMMILSPLVMIIGLNNVVGLQYLIPLKEDTKYTICVTIGAVTNLAINLCLIPFLYSYGAAIATIIAETIVTTVAFVFARKNIRFLTIIKESWKYIVASLIMFGTVFAIQWFLQPSILFTFLLVGAGGVVYFGTLLIMRDELLFSTISKITRKVFRSKKQ